MIEQLFAREMPAPFLSLITDDCIARGVDYNAGGARYNTSYIQGVGIGTLTDSLAAVRTHVYEKQTITMDELLASLDTDFSGHVATPSNPAQPLAQVGQRRRCGGWADARPLSTRSSA